MMNSEKDGKNNDKRPALLLLNGPNLNMLGRRNPDQYGSFTLVDVEQSCKHLANSKGFELFCFQSNHEGQLIDRIHEAIDYCDGMLINPGAFTHYSYALRDAIEICPFPVMEIHISDISKREDFRKISVVKDVCCAQVAGFGLDSYKIGIEQLIRIIREKENIPL